MTSCLGKGSKKIFKKSLEFSRLGEGGSAIGLEDSRLFLKIFFDPFPKLFVITYFITKVNRILFWLN